MRTRRVSRVRGMGHQHPQYSQDPYRELLHHIPPPPPPSGTSAASQPGALTSTAHAPTSHTPSPSVTSAASQPRSLLSTAPDMTFTLPRQPTTTTTTLQQRSNAEAQASGVHAPNSLPSDSEGMLESESGDDHWNGQSENREVRQKRIFHQDVVLFGDSTIKYVDRERFMGRFLKTHIQRASNTATSKNIARWLGKKP